MEYREGMSDLGPERFTVRFPLLPEAECSICQRVAPAWWFNTGIPGYNCLCPDCYLDVQEMVDE